MPNITSVEMGSLVVDVAAPLRFVAKLRKFSSYLQGRSRNRTRLFARNIIAPGREGERELSTRDWIFNRFTLAAAASGR